MSVVPGLGHRNVGFFYLGHGYVCGSSILVRNKSAKLYNFVSGLVRNPTSTMETDIPYLLR